MRVQTEYHAIKNLYMHWKNSKTTADKVYGAVKQKPEQYN